MATEDVTGHSVNRLPSEAHGASNIPDLDSCIPRTTIYSRVVLYKVYIVVLSTQKCPHWHLELFYGFTDSNISHLIKQFLLRVNMNSIVV